MIMATVNSNNENGVNDDSNKDNGDGHHGNGDNYENDDNDDDYKTHLLGVKIKEPDLSSRWTLRTIDHVHIYQISTEYMSIECIVT